MKIEKIPEGYLLARKGGNSCELWRTFNGAESFACDAIDELIAERDALRAKITEMEQQVPICRAEDLRHAESLLPSLGLKPEDKLYALPGAKGE